MNLVGNLVGRRFGRLIVLKQVKGRPIHRTWLCICDCGTKCEKITGNLTRKNQTPSCGHKCKIVRSIFSKRVTTHGMSKHRAYHIWQGILKRCFDLRHRSWRYYGGRGIRVCVRWQKSFENFWEDMGRTYRDYLIIDRINNDGHYTPSNCRWTTYTVNNRNRRDNLIGFPPNFQDIALKKGIRKQCLYARIRRGMTWGQVINTPMHVQLNIRKRKKYERKKPT